MSSVVTRLAKQRATRLGIDLKVNKYDTFRKTYRDNYVGFAKEILEVQPTPYQEEILTQLPLRKRVCIRGPHGLGKTALMAWIVLCFALTRDNEDWKIPTTASVWRQLAEYLWPEVHKWSKRIRWDRIGRLSFNERTELLTLHLKLSNGSAFALASDKPGALEGAHADQLLYILDEAKIIPDDNFDSIEGAFSGPGDNYAVVMSTPGEPVGRFHDIQARRPGYEDWWTKAVTLQEAIAAGRISQEWANQRKRQWGKKSAVYQNRVLGNFAVGSEDGVIPLSWVERANEVYRQWVSAGKPGTLNYLGIDVGLGGKGDKSTFALNYNYKIDDIRVYNNLNQDTATMELTGYASGILDANPEAQAVVDIIGIGAGVGHRLRELGKKALFFSAGVSTKRKDKSGEMGFADVRSAAWWLTRELLDPESGVEVGLPDDDELTGDLTAPRYRVVSGGKYRVESKEDIRKRLKRSTDKGDSAIEALVGYGLCGSGDVEIMGAADFLRKIGG